MKGSIANNSYYNIKLNYDILYKWMFCDIYGRRIEDELSENNIKTIAIYGMGELGSLLYRKLENSKVRVDCFVDKYSGALHYGVDDIEVIRPEGLVNRKGIDLVIITVLKPANQIKMDLKVISEDIEAVSLEDIVMGM